MIGDNKKERNNTRAMENTQNGGGCPAEKEKKINGLLAPSERRRRKGRL